MITLYTFQGKTSNSVQVYCEKSVSEEPGFFFMWDSALAVGFTGIPITCGKDDVGEWDSLERILPICRSLSSQLDENDAAALPLDWLLWICEAS